VKGCKLQYYAGLEMYSAWPEAPAFLQSDRNSIQGSLIKNITSVFRIPNMFELIHTKGVMKIYEMLRKKATCSLRGNTLY